MKKYLPLAASALLLAACSEKPGYEITGTVSNADLNGKYVYLYEYGNPDVPPLDSALVGNRVRCLLLFSSRRMLFPKNVANPICLKQPSPLKTEKSSPTSTHSLL